MQAENVDLLCVLGFAFDPQAIGVTEDDGITVEATPKGSPMSRGSDDSAASPSCWSG
jgi:adenine-specific DNA-methyltransferase